MKIPRFLMCMPLMACATNVIGEDDIPPLEMVPPSVWNLLKWPSPELVQQKKMVSLEGSVRSAVLSSESWLRRIVDSKWLPEKMEPLCLENEFNETDVVRYRWTSNDRTFAAAQTASTFVLEMRPSKAEPGEQDSAARLNQVREICRDVFIKTGFRWTGRGEKVPIPELNRRILDASFKPDRVKRGGKDLLLAGRPVSMHEAGATSPASETADVELINRRIRTEDDKANPNWFDSSSAWMYWFRNVNWFADQEHIVIYLLKTEGGPVFLTFGTVIDNGWFGPE